MLLRKSPKSTIAPELPTVQFSAALKSIITRLYCMLMDLWEIVLISLGEIPPGPPIISVKSGLNGAKEVNKKSELCNFAHLQ